MKLKTTFFLFLITYVTVFAPDFVGEDEQKVLTEDVKVNIPSVNLDAEICRSSREICLNSGVWMKYFDDDGNILLTGHSFTIFPFAAGVFYSLPDLKIGDEIYISLDENLVYIVEEIYVTSKYDLDVENFDGLKNSLVLYSCFPLWSAAERIVVRARLCNLCEYEL
jgi:LPXTG-site transpeptidase (sortase) family protein